MYNLQRFLNAQQNSYDQALREIKAGCKTSHWIWYIFPQLKGLGRSYNSEFYGIENLDEAKEYLTNPVLRERLIEISQALLEVEKKSAVEILSRIDATKVKSSMTLFYLADPDIPVFKAVLDKYYDGKLSGRTKAMLGIPKDKINIKENTK